MIEGQISNQKREREKKQQGKGKKGGKIESGLI